MKDGDRGARCPPELLAAALAEIIRDERVRSAHLAGYDEAIGRLIQTKDGGADPLLHLR